MGKAAVLVVTLLLPVLVAVMSALSEEPGTTAPPARAQEKDECLLLARRCGNQAMSLQDKVDRLNEEIAKGRTVYTPEELQILRQKLEEVNRTLDFLLEQ